MEYITILCAVVSAIGAGFSAYFVYNARKIENKLVINKSDIERITQTIDHLRQMQAIVKRGYDFDDISFKAIWEDNFEKAKNAVFILRQNPALREMLKDIDDKSFRFEDIDSSIEALGKCMGLLLK